MDDFHLDWKGDEVLRVTKENGAKIISEFALTVEGEAKKELHVTKENGAKIISEFALTVEGEAKKELRKGHGVLTGTLQRSIHTALPGYDWGGDDVTPSAGAPERGGGEALPNASDNQLTVEVGSGLVYAMAVHQGHHNFSGYHYLTNGLSKAKAKLASIVARHQVKR